MKDYGLVSVVTATYNMGHYLPIAVRSVLDQTYQNFEINVIDDGSTDDTKEVMKQFTDDPRVHYYHQENQGQAKAKNHGIRVSTGKFVAFLDADDRWLPAKLEKQLPLFEQNPRVGVVYTDASYMDENGKIIEIERRKKYFRGQVTEKLFKDNFVNFPSAIVKKECFNEVGAFDENLPMSIDWDLWLRISTKYEFDYVDEKLFVYRQWPGQMSHKFDERFECILTIMNRFTKEHADLLSNKTIRRAWAHTFTERSWKARALEKKRIKAMKFLLKAVRHDPTFMPAWKEIIKVGLFL